MWLFLCVFYVINSQPINDLVTDLPGLNWNVNYKQYSGYLDLNNGHHLHYWFMESQTNPAKDPVVLWLNGGPGCSSMDGLLYEHGPFHVNNDDYSLYENPYSWNLNASVLYLEAPICVGYSYTDDGNCVASDNSTMNDNYEALLVFFEKFPMYQSNNFFIMGESYAGVYVPTLSWRVLKGNANNEGTKINLKAFAVGDPVGLGKELTNSGPWYNYYHGWVSEQTWNNLLSECCDPPYTRSSCDFSNPKNARCSALILEATAWLFDSSINVYDWIVDCYRGKINNKEYSNIGEYTKAIQYIKNEYYKIYSKYNDTISDARIHKIFNDDNEVNVLCTNSHGAFHYMNNATVKQAIHVDIPATQNITWNICSNTLVYHTDSTYHDESYLYNEMWEMDPELYTLVYNGDVDPGINVLASQWFVNNFNKPLLKEYREWFITNENGVQTGGWTQNYEKISFVSIRAAGHMVPQFTPNAALKLFQYFINNSTLD